MGEDNQLVFATPLAVGKTLSLRRERRKKADGGFSAERHERVLERREAEGKSEIRVLPAPRVQQRHGLACSWLYSQLRSWVFTSLCSSNWAASWLCG